MLPPELLLAKLTNKGLWISKASCSSLKLVVGQTFTHQPGMPISGCKRITGKGTESVSQRPVFIPWEEVAGALGMGRLSKPAYYYARAVYCGDQNDLKILQKYAFQLAQRLAFKHRWKIIKGRDTLKRAAFLAALEHAYPHLFNHCEKCQGRGVTRTKCKRCDGSGIKHKSKSWYARHLMIDEKSYRESWLDRYQSIFSELYSYNQMVLLHLCNQFCYRNK